MNMLSKTILVIGFAVLLLGASGSAFSKENMVAYAAGTVYIRADGLVEGTDKITNENNVTYTFTDDINDSIVVERSDILIDGDGHVLNGSWSLTYGFNLTSVNNVTIQNVNIVKFGYAMWLEGVSQCTISNNNATDNEGGIWLVSSTYNTISGNNVTGSVEAVALDSSSGNNITDNNLENSYDYGVYVRNNSANNTVSGNNIKGTINGAGIYLNGSPNNVISGNNIKDSPNEHICLLYSSNNNSISGNTLTNSTADVGVYVYACSLNSFWGNNITGNANAGIAFDVTGDSTISENNISENLKGVYLWYCSNITVSGNDIAANNASGIVLDNSGNNIINGNNIAANNLWGINPANSNNNTISSNNIRNNNVGINSASSDFNIVSANDIIDNEYSGIYLESSSNNTFYHNNLINNTNQVIVELDCANDWDKGYPSGGNYWSEYTDVDNNSGPDQNITGVPDGIWDHSYIIDENNTDHYPLKFPYEAQSPAITIPSPENKTYAVNASIPLTFTIDEFAPWIGYSLDGQTNVTITGNTTLPTLSDGWHYVILYANDTFGNMGSATVYFAVDTTKPDIADVIQDPLTNILPDTVVKINVTVTDATSEIAQVLLNCTFTNGTDTWQATFGMTHLTGDVWNATIPPQSYGTNVTYVIIAEDGAGNIVTTLQIYGYEYEYQVIPELLLQTILLAFMMTAMPIIVFAKKKKTVPT
jgi:parallel beta-helix repeat protein